jgi:predicted pyridoxine 5'-phosphate oxidase superfamily flavin-nucleotide-binding protein
MSLLPDWPHGEAPFHAGEQAVQARAGTHARMAEIGRRVIRAAMPQQHREFFPLLPFVVLGAVDRTGQPWAAWLEGASAGFVTAPDAEHLDIRAVPPPGDPLRPLLQAGSVLGLLCIELPTRRRNRANGRVVQVGPHGFTLQVLQSFGNCPKYIQRREPRVAPAGPLAVDDTGSGVRLDRLEGRAAALVREAGTFFIATHAPGDGASAGSDVSHRGGPPGFVSLSDDGRSLMWPDYLGNGFFNTLGNLAVEPRAGLLFVDFERGDLLHVNGRTELVWDGPELAATLGAQRLVRLQVDEAWLRAASSRLRWRSMEASR